ncbi:MAG: lactonase family protein [Candidatus Sumerlaeia bacterium]
MTPMNDSSQILFISAARPNDEGGIFTCRFDSESGALERVTVCDEIPNALYLTQAPESKNLYAVNDEGSAETSPSGMIHCLRMNSANGQLRHAGKQSTAGTTPCFVTVDGRERYAFVANFRGIGPRTSRGFVSMLPLDGLGKIDPASCVIQHPGQSSHPERQTASHPHSINLDARDRFALVADLGVDKVYAYEVDWDKGILVETEHTAYPAPALTGPRHMAFHPNNRFVYLVNEIGNSVFAYAFDPDTGALKDLWRIPTLPGDYTDGSACADIHVSPDGLFLYVSNRGHDSITIYRVDPATGYLDLLDFVKSGGENPRDFIIDPTGNFLLVANQSSDKVVIFQRDKTSGLIEAVDEAPFPAPVCMLFSA